MILRSQVTGLLLMGVPFLGIFAVALVPGEAAPGVDRINYLVAVGAIVLGMIVFRFGRKWPDKSFDVIATTGFLGVSYLNVINLRGTQGVDLTPLYGVVLMVVGLFFPIRRTVFQCALMSASAFAVYATTEDSLNAALGHWMIATLWAIVGGAIVAVLRHRMGQIFESLTLVAETDMLTGLVNRAQFLAEAEEQMKTTNVAVLLLDLDRFKEVNDHFGHRAGDTVLRVVADRLGSLPDSRTVARLGGDEFAVTIVGVSVAERAQVFAKRLIAAIEHPIELGDIAVQVSASVGVELTQATDPVDVNASMQRADAAMYKAKSEDIGFCLYSPELDADQRRRRILLADLEKAIQTDAISLCFQPKIELATNSVAGVEALARWNHPTLGTIPPNEFVGLAEQSGLIDSLTAGVLDLALSQCRRWIDAGVSVPIAVNVSSRNFSDRFVAVVSERLHHHQVPPSLLLLEVTERRFTDDTVQARAVLGDLRALGVQIAIDDFGTGYSSLAHLRILPVDELKIDSSFVFEMEADSEALMITQSAIQLGQNLGLRVVAEGVETAGAAAALLSLGCDLVQGYFYSKPLPAHEFELWLVERGEWARLSNQSARVSEHPADC
jgi:diguanylate cyclase